MRILCVDDDSTARLLYKEALEQKFPDDSIEISDSGENAMAMIEKSPYDIILTDLVMPGMSGIEVIARAKEIDPRQEIIVLTAQASIETAVEAMRLGARDYVEKPVNFDLMEERIENIRDYRQRMQEAEDYRLAKETSEEQAGHQLHLLEKQIQDMKIAGAKAREIIRDAQSEISESIAKEVNTQLDIIMGKGSV
ncbi:MAG: response regulator [Candidatus Sumerlaeia bacterium]